MRLLIASLAACLACGPVLAEQGDAEDQALIQTYIVGHVDPPSADAHGASQTNESGAPVKARPTPASTSDAPRLAHPDQK